jgi:hypothetical protein
MNYNVAMMPNVVSIGAARSEKWKKFVRSLPCSICHTDLDIHAHHIRGLKMGGVGSKIPDWLCIPLCSNDHNELHNIGHESFELKYGVTQLEIFSLVFLKAVYDGVLVLADVS